MEAVPVPQRVVKGDGEGDLTLSCLDCVRMIGFLLFMCSGFLFLMYLFAVLIGWPWPHFSVAISSVKGISATSNHTFTTSSPVFTLSLRVDNSHNSIYRLCFDAGYALISYQSTRIVEAPMLIREEHCIGKLEKQDVTVYAWSRELQLPAFVHDQLYEETMERKAVFFVKLWLTPLYRGRIDYNVRIDCPMAVANAAMASCSVSYS